VAQRVSASRGHKEYTLGEKTLSLARAHLDVDAPVERVDALDGTVEPVDLGSRLEARNADPLIHLRLERLRHASKEHSELSERLGTIAACGLVDGDVVQAERRAVADGALNCDTREHRRAA